jgi:hypothetical protein
MMSTKGKFGRFLFFLGALSLISFYTTLLNEDPLSILLFIGLVLSTLGGILWLQGKPPPQSSGRFRTIRSIRTARQKFAENKAEKQKAEKK